MSRCSLSGFGCDGVKYRSGCGFEYRRNVELSACKMNRWGSWASIIEGLPGKLPEKEHGFGALFLRSMAIKHEGSMWKMFPGAERDGVP